MYHKGVPSFWFFNSSRERLQMQLCTTTDLSTFSDVETCLWHALKRDINNIPTVKKGILSIFHRKARTTTFIIAANELEARTVQRQSTTPVVISQMTGQIDDEFVATMVKIMAATAARFQYTFVYPTVVHQTPELHLTYTINITGHELEINW